MMKVQNYKSRSQQDRGWAWVVLAGTLISKIIIATGNTAGLYSIVFHEVFDHGAASISFSVSLQRGLALFIGPLSSLVSEYIGAQRAMVLGGSIAAVGFIISYFATNFHHVLIGYGVIVGIGHGLCFVPGMVILGFYFEKYRDIAFGIATTAPGIAMLIFGPFVQWLIEYYGWRGSLLILAGVSMEMLVCGMVMVKPYETQRFNEIHGALDKQDNTNEYSANDASTNKLISLPAQLDKSRLQSTKENGYNSKADMPIKISCETNHNVSRRNKSEDERSVSKMYMTLCTDQRLWLFNLNMFCLHAGMAIFHLHFPGYVVSKGSTKVQSSTLISVNGGANILCALATGVVSNCKVLNNRTLYVVTAVLTGFISMIGTLFCSTFIGQVIFAVLIGLVMNSYNSLVSPIVIDVFGLKNFNAVYGMAACFSGLGYLAGPPFAGWLYDMLASYQYTFYVSGGLYVLSAICVLGVHFFKQPNTAKNDVHVLYQ